MPILGGFGAGSARGYGQRGIAKGLINATGGTITCCGDYRIHTFTGPGTFEVQCINACVPAPTQKIDYVIVAGGGGGPNSPHGGGGGGGGGFRESHCATISGCYTASPLATPTSIPISGSTSYPITVGAGGASSPGVNNCTTQGGTSSGFGISATGGGSGGQSGNSNQASPGGTGGSGGGGGGVGGSFSTPSGSGNNPPTTPPQGNPGGGGTNAPGDWGGAGGGGGGATQSGTGAFSTYDPGNGGDGAGTAMNPAQGTPGPTPGVRYFSGGAGGKTQAPPQPYPVQGEGGAGGGGGQPGYTPTGQSTPWASDPEGYIYNGGANLGGGTWVGGAGSSGIVMIRYKYK